MDYKEWISQRAFEIAEQEYKADFSDLDQDLADKVFAQAQEEYVNREAARIDALYDMAVERMEGR